MERQKVFVPLTSTQEHRQALSAHRLSRALIFRRSPRKGRSSRQERLP